MLYPTIRAKIGMALDGQAGARGWHPSDPSARGLLEPWTSVWPRGETQAFLARHIMPKLLACMQHELVIDPSRPTSDPSQAPQLEHLFSWYPVYSALKLFFFGTSSEPICLYKQRTSVFGALGIFIGSAFCPLPTYYTSWSRRSSPNGSVCFAYGWTVRVWTSTKWRAGTSRGSSAFPQTSSKSRVYRVRDTHEELFIVRYTL